MLCLLLAVSLPLHARADSVGGDELDCLIEPDQHVTVAAQVIGVVSSVTVQRGDYVEEGQVVATLHSSAEEAIVALSQARAKFGARIRAAKANAEFENRLLERQLELKQQGVLSEGQLDEIQSSVQVAEANVSEVEEQRLMAELELKRARAVLDMRTIRSPISGVVVKLILHKGEYADPPHVMEIASIDPLRVRAGLPPLGAAS